MSTALFLRNTTLNGIGSFQDLAGSAGASSVNAIVNTAASGTNIQWTASGGGSVIEWISGRAPAGGFTLSGAVSIKLNANESATAANAGGRLRLYKRTSAGVETELSGSPSDRGAEFGTSLAAVTWSFTPSSGMAFAEDDRLVCRFFITAAGGTMASGRTCTMRYNNSSANTGDTSITLTETVAFKAEDRSGTASITEADDTLTTTGASLVVLPYAIDWSTGSLPSKVTHGGGANGTRWNSSGVLVTASGGRITYDPTTLACLGLLAEEARTNYITNSRDHTDGGAWSGQNITGTAGQSSPDGGNNATLITASGGFNFHDWWSNDSTAFDPSAQVWSGSIFGKTGNNPYVFLTCELGQSPGNDFFAGSFDLSTPAVGATEVKSGTTLAGHGVQAYPWGARIWLAGQQFTNGIWNLQGGTLDALTPFAAGDAFGNYASSGSQSYYVYQAQVEKGAFPSSPIFTSSGSVTRSADTATANDSTLLGARGLEVYFRTPISIGSGQRQTLIQADDGTANNRWRIDRDASNHIHFIVTSGGTDQCDLDLGTVAHDTDGHVRVRWGTNDFAGSLNDGTVVTDTSGSVPAGIAQYRFGYNQAGGNYFMGTIAKATFATTYTDGELQGSTGANGVASITEASDTITATGALSIAGTSTITEAGDTISAAATLAIDGAASIMEADDTTTAAGGGFAVASAAIVEADDGLVATGALALAGAASIAEASDSVSAAGALTIAGSSSIGEASDSLVAAGTVAIAGAASITEESDDLAATAVLAITGAASIAEANDGMAASGALSIAGQADITEDDDTISSSNTSDITATAAIAEESDGLSATGTLAIVGAASITEEDDQASSQAVAPIAGAGEITEDDDAVAAVGALSISGSASLVEDDDTIAATATLSGLSIGEATIVEADDLVISIGRLTIVGIAAIAEDDDTTVAQGTIAQRFFEQDLRDKLLSHAPLSALIGDRASWASVPQGSPRPLIALWNEGRRQDDTTTGRETLKRGVVRIDCRGATIGDAVRVRRAARAAIDGFRGQVGSTIFQGVFVDNVALFETDTASDPTVADYTAALDLEVWFTGGA